MIKETQILGLKKQVKKAVLQLQDAFSTRFSSLTYRLFTITLAN
jgi:hypothetical protein